MAKMASVTQRPNHNRRVGDGISLRRSCSGKLSSAPSTGLPATDALAKSLVSSCIRGLVRPFPVSPAAAAPSAGRESRQKNGLYVCEKVRDSCAIDADALQMSLDVFLKCMGKLGGHLARRCIFPLGMDRS